MTTFWRQDVRREHADLVCSPGWEYPLRQPEKSGKAISSSEMRSRSWVETWRMDGRRQSTGSVLSYIAVHEVKLPATKSNCSYHGQNGRATTLQLRCEACVASTS